jgi:murein DD-endopeptidase MepM/ murein hydrolase activator NlpD
MAVSLFSFKKTPASKITSFVDPTKFGGAFSGANRPTLKSEAAEKTTALKEVKELSYIRRALETLVTLEKRHFDIVTDSIKDFVLSEEKKQARDEEAQQEKKPDKTKKDQLKNPLVKQGAKTLEGIGNFFQGLIKTFIAYKVLQWAGNPENAKKIQDFVNFFSNIFKFLNAIVGFGVDKLFSGLSKLVDGEGVTRVFGFLEAVVGFFTLKWLLNPTKIISDIKMIGNLFTKVIPNAINGVINFFSNLIPKAAGEAADEALSQAGRQISEGASSAAKGAATGAEAAGTTAKAASTTGKAAGTVAKGAGAAAAKGGAKVTGKSLLKALPVIGAVSSAFFAVDRASKGDWLGAGGEVLSGAASLIPGWGTAASLGIDAALIGRDIAKEQGLPMLAKGGIVTKPTEAIVGEAGPEAILPLDKLGSFGVDEFKGQVDKQIPSFIKLLTLPFKIIGAGIVALISSSVSFIPGLGPILMPLISNVASMFGIPPSLVKGMSNFASVAIKSVGEGMSTVKEVFGIEEPKVTKTKADEFKPSGDTSVRGLLGDILSALISKNDSNSSSTEPTTTPPSSTPASSPTPDAAPKIGGSAKALPENASLAKAGDSAVQNLEGTVDDLKKKGYRYINNTNNRFFQDSQGRLYQATKSGSTFAAGDVFKLQSATQEQIDKGFTSPGSEHTVGSRNNQEIQRQLELFRIINKGGNLEKETTGSKTQVKKDGKWIDKGGPVRGSGIGDKISILAEPGEYMLNKNAARAMGGPKILDHINHGMFPRFGSGGPVSTRKFLRLGGGWAPVPEDSRGVVLGRGLEHGYTARDLPMPIGTPLLSPFDGKVHEVNKNPGGWGNYIVLKSSNGIFSLFGHVSSYTKKQGDPIKAGEQVATSGHQHGGGRSTGPHLHWEIGSSWNGTIGGKVEPIAWTQGKAVPSVTGQTSSTAATDTTSQDQNNTPQPTWETIAPALADLAKLLTGAPSAPELPPPQPAKITGSIPARSQQLQSTQKENAALQAQRRAGTQTGPNIVNVPTAPQVTASSTTQPLAQPLGGTTPPIPLSLYPVAP